jgi:hypothetical protein
MRDKGLGGVIHWLVHGHVDNMGAHAGRDDEIAKALAFEDLADVFGTKHYAIHFAHNQHTTHRYLNAEFTYHLQTSVYDIHLVFAPE